MGADMYGRNAPPSSPGKGAVLWGLRDHFGVSRAELARALDIREGQLSRIEKHRASIDDVDFKAAVWFIMEANRE